MKAWIIIGTLLAVTGASPSMAQTNGTEPHYVMGHMLPNGTYEMGHMEGRGYPTHTMQSDRAAFAANRAQFAARRSLFAAQRTATQAQRDYSSKKTH